MPPAAARCSSKSCAFDERRMFHVAQFCPAPIAVNQLLIAETAACRAANIGRQRAETAIQQIVIQRRSGRSGRPTAGPPATRRKRAPCCRCNRSTARPYPARRHTPQVQLPRRAGHVADVRAIGRIAHRRIHQACRGELFVLIFVHSSLSHIQSLVVLMTFDSL